MSGRVKRLIERLRRAFRGGNSASQPIVEPQTALGDVLSVVKNGRALFETQFRVQLSDRDLRRSLGSVARRYRIPPQILFAELQLLALAQQRPYETVAPTAVDSLLDEKGDTLLVDCREGWEQEAQPITDATILSETLWREAIDRWPRDRRLVLFCHHGLRSLDVANAFLQAGFSRVAVIDGGLESWAQVSARELPRYDAPAC